MNQLGGDTQSPILKVDNLHKWFPVHGGIFRREVARVKAVSGVSFELHQGETLGIVGESGCGKSTLGRTVLQLYRPDLGKVIFEGRELSGLSDRDLRDVRRDLQVVFQDPYESLNSRMTVRQILMEPFIIHRLYSRIERQKRVSELLDLVGLPENALDKYPHEFSGGQRQRIGIARAVALKPKVIVCDEPVSALDVSIQAQVINLLIELQREMNLALVFIAHDLAVVRHVSDRVAVMYLGKIVELTDAESIYLKPKHPYTKSLISAIPEIGSVSKDKVLPKGEVPSPIFPPNGCAYHPRCPKAREICKRQVPEIIDLNDKEGSRHFVSCHFPD